MSEVFSIKKQEKFNVAMVVGHITSLPGGTKYKDVVENWTYDVEMSDLALAVYNKVQGKGYSNEKICEEVDTFFASNYNISDLPSAGYDEDFNDFWYGVECGAYFGLPTKDSLAKCNKVIHLFAKQLEYGFVHEVIEANGLA